MAERLDRVALDRRIARYADILDAAQHHATETYGSAANAIANMVRQSALYQEWQAAKTRKKRKVPT